MMMITMMMVVMMQKFPKQIAYVIKKFTIVCRNCMLKLHAFSASFLCFKLCCHLCTIKLLIQFPLPVCGHTLICSEIHILNYQHLSAGNSGCCSYQWSKKDYVSEVWPPTGSFFIPQKIYEDGEPRWNDTDMGKRTWKKAVPVPLCTSQI